MAQQSQGLTDWDNCARRKVCHLKIQIHVKFTYWSQCFATTPKARSPDDAERRVPTFMYDRIALMLTCCRHGRKKYIGSRCSTGLIAVHRRLCARHGRRDSTRTRGGPIDRRRACEEETAKGRFHLQVSTLSQHPITLRWLPLFRVGGVPYR